MSHRQLDNLVRIGQLKAESPSESECQGLVRSGLRRLEDAGLKELSLESRFDLAYNAAHALALAALRFRGYRSESRYLVFQCLQHTIDLPNEQWRASIRRTASAISLSTRVIWMWMSNSLRHCCVLRRKSQNGLMH